jgi:ubiquitin-activating enzyme E1
LGYTKAPTITKLKSSISKITTIQDFLEQENLSNKKRKMETKQLEKDAGFMDKYSRQIGAFGLETMAKVSTSKRILTNAFLITFILVCSLQLVKLKVLVVGLQGVGIECAKNLILAGPGAITLHDGTNLFS